MLIIHTVDSKFNSLTARQQYINNMLHKGVTRLASVGCTIGFPPPSQ